MGEHDEAKQAAADALARLVGDSDKRSQDIVTAYVAMRDVGALSAMTLLEYRCATRGCLLLHVWVMLNGERYWYAPPYRLSPDVNEAETAESARVKRTTDGNRKWRARGGYFDDEMTESYVRLDDEAETLVPIPGVGITLQCNHFRGFIPSERLVADIADRPGKVQEILLDTP